MVSSFSIKDTHSKGIARNTVRPLPLFCFPHVSDATLYSIIPCAMPIRTAIIPYFSHETVPDFTFSRI
jgi:hypothetical protein